MKRMTRCDHCHCYTDTLRSNTCRWCGSCLPLGPAVHPADVSVALAEHTAHALTKLEPR